MKSVTWIHVDDRLPTESGWYVVQTVRRYLGGRTQRSIVAIRWMSGRPLDQQAATGWKVARRWYGPIPNPPHVE